MALDITSLKTDTIVNGSSNGVISLSVNDGVAPYTYVWDDDHDIDSSIRTGLSADTYICDITDYFGQTGQITVEILEDDLLTVDIAQTGGHSIEATPAGGVAPYTYIWNTFPTQTTAEATSLADDATYTVRVMDAHNTTVFQEFYLPD